MTSKSASPHTGPDEGEALWPAPPPVFATRPNRKARRRQESSRKEKVRQGDGDDPPWTMPIPEFGRKYYGLGRCASYEAAKRGDIPVVRIGGRIMGLPRVAEAQLSGDGAATAPKAPERVSNPELRRPSGPTSSICKSP
jgi:hypothetical protein